MRNTIGNLLEHVRIPDGGGRFAALQVATSERANSASVVQTLLWAVSN
jgi:hypothetical protein